MIGPVRVHAPGGAEYMSNQIPLVEKEQNVLLQACLAVAHFLRIKEEGLIEVWSISEAINRLLGLK